MPDDADTPSAGVGRDDAELGTRQFQTIVQNASDAILVVDPDGRIHFVNPAAVELFGRPAEVLLDDAFRFPAVVSEDTEIDVVRPDDRRRVAEMRVTEISWNGDGAYLATLRDVTERHEAERSLRDFVSMVSHELRTPIFTARGFIDLLRDDWGDLSDEDVLGYLGSVSQQVERMGRMTNDLLTVSRIDSEGIEPQRAVVDVPRMLQATADEHAVLGASVRVDAEAGLTAWADPDHVRQILVNYLTNAIKYGAPPITLEAVSDPDGGVVIRVRDEGDGVPERFLPRLFERFSRASNGGDDTSGTGLGLAIVRGLADVEDGEAWYEPNEPTGACFCVRLRRPPADAPAEAEPEGG